MLTHLPRKTETISFNSAPKQSRRDIATRERPRHRCRLRPVAVANQTGTAIYAFVKHGKCFAHRAKVAFSRHYVRLRSGTGRDLGRIRLGTFPSAAGPAD